MKKIFTLCLFCFFGITLSMAQEPGSCFDQYNNGLAPTYNALARAVDGQYSVCAFANGAPSKKSAERKALSDCEKLRKAPDNENNGVRKIMTHCRIVQFKAIGLD
jgi:hypothetical protein